VVCARTGAREKINKNASKHFFIKNQFRILNTGNKSE